MCKPPVFAGACNIQNKPFPGVPSLLVAKPQVGGWRIKFQLHGSYPSWHEGSYYPKHVSKFQTKKKSSSSSGLCSGFLLVQNLRLGTLVFLLGCWLQARTSGV
jgi:hypothetical protein